MLTLKQGIKISAIIDKLQIKIIDPKAPQEQVGADLMLQIASKAHLAEQEIYDLVASAKKITVEEAQEVDLVAFVKELISDPAVVNFFKSAAKSKGRK